MATEVDVLVAIDGGTRDQRYALAGVLALRVAGSVVSECPVCDPALDDAEAEAATRLALADYACGVADGGAPMTFAPGYLIEDALRRGRPRMPRREPSSVVLRSSRWSAWPALWYWLEVKPDRHPAVLDGSMPRTVAADRSTGGRDCVMVLRGVGATVRVLDGELSTDQLASIIIVDLMGIGAIQVAAND